MLINIKIIFDVNNLLGYKFYKSFHKLGFKIKWVNKCNHSISALKDLKQYGISVAIFIKFNIINVTLHYNVNIKAIMNNNELEWLE